MTDHNDTPSGRPHDQTLIPRSDYVPDHAMLVNEADEEDQAHSSVTPDLFWHAFRRRWFAALSLGLICAAGVAAAAWMLNKDRFTATFQFRVSPADESVVFDDFRVAARSDYEIFKNSQQQYVKSDWVLNAALRPDQVAKLPMVQQEQDPVQWLAKELRVVFPGSGAEMNVSVTADSQEEAAWLVAAVSKAYLDEVVNQERMTRARRLLETERTLESLQSDLNTKRNSLDSLAKNLGTGDRQALALQQRIAQDKWGSVQKELLTVQIQLERAKAELAMKQAMLARASDADGEGIQSLVTELDLETVLASDLISANLKAQAQAVQETLEQLRVYGTPNQVAKRDERYTKQLQEIDQQLMSRREELEAELRRRALMYFRSEVSQLESEVVAQTALETRWAEEEQKYRAEIEKFGGSSFDMENLQREITMLDQLRQPLEEQAQKLRVELGRPPRVTRVTRVKSDTLDLKTPDDKLTLAEMAEAIRPRSPDPSKQVAKTAAAGLGAFCCVAGGILFLEVRSKRVNSPTEVSQQLGLQVIGAIPLVPSAAVGRGIGRSTRLQRWRTLLNESMRGVMVRLVHEARIGQSQVVMVSSAMAGEGKSTLATNLAIAMARAGYRTVLVDCDLRRQTLSELFDLPASPGVGEVLRHEVSLENSINTVHTDNLSVITAGRWSPYDVASLANGDTCNLFEELRQRYQFVIVDGSPILGVAESQLLCRHADTVLLSVLRDVSSGPKILSACQTLTAFGVHCLYAVVTGTSNGDYANYYGGYGYAQDEPVEE